MAFRQWLLEKWYDHCDEVYDFEGVRPNYTPGNYFSRYKWWLRRQYRHEQSINSKKGE